MTAAVRDDVAAVAASRPAVAGWRPLRTCWQLGFARRLVGTRLGGLGALILVGLLVLAATADFVTSWDPYYQNYDAFLRPPSEDFPLGTDQIGRDVFSRIVYGTRISLQVGVITVGIGVVVGVLIGLVAGFYQGWLDEVLMRCLDALHAFPALVLALGITAALGPGIVNTMIAIGVVSVPAFARLVRGQALSVRERDYVLAARVLGARPWRVMFQHIWPNVTAPIVVHASLSAGFAILAEASLSFLGLGVQPPEPSWGSMLRAGSQYLSIAPWLSLYPGIAIYLAVLGFNLLGDGLRQALDPRLRGRQQA